jgi:hypothetical protein
MKRILAILLIGLAVESMAFAENVKPGDVDYPALNTSAHENLAVSGRAPENWELRLSATYYPKEGGGIFKAVPGGVACEWAVGDGVTRRYSVDFEIPVVRRKDTFTAAIPVDRYKEGRCGWHLYEVSYALVKRPSDPPTWGRLALAPQDIVPTYPPIDPSDHRTQVDLWCWDSPLGKQFWINGTQLDCNLAGSVGISPMKFIPAARRGNNSAVYFFPEMHSVSFIFHDLDAEAAIEKAKQ